MAARIYFVFLSTLFIGVGFSVNASKDLQCSHPMPNVLTNWIVMSPDCVGAVNSIINKKFSNAVQYLALGAYFSKYSVNRMGFSDTFYEIADEERDHPLEFIDYLLLRGKYTDPNDIIQLEFIPEVTEWDQVSLGLDDALTMVSNTTRMIHNSIEICLNQGIHDYNLGNWMSGYFTKKQYKMQFRITNLISTLKKMEKLHDKLGEYLVDNEL